MITRVRGLFGKVRGIGPVFFIQRSLQRLLGSRNFDLHWFAIYEQRASDIGDIEEVPGRRWATLDDVDSSRALGYTPEICHRLFENGAKPCVIERDGKIVAFTWFEANTIDQQDIIFKLEPEEMWSTLTIVAPDYRGQGLMKSLLLNGAKELAEQEGIDRFLGIIESLNRNPKHAAQKMRGTRVLGTLLVVRLGTRLLVRDKAGVLIPADGLSRRSRWITRRNRLEASVAKGATAL